MPFDVNMHELQPERLCDMCPACFGTPQATHLFVCFDGNFQHKRFGTKGEELELSARDLRDKRMFADGKPKVHGDVSLIIYVADCRTTIAHIWVVTTSRQRWVGLCRNTTGILAL